MPISAASKLIPEFQSRTENFRESYVNNVLNEYELRINSRRLMRHSLATTYDLKNGKQVSKLYDRIEQ